MRKENETKSDAGNATAILKSLKSTQVCDCTTVVLAHSDLECYAVGPRNLTNISDEPLFIESRACSHNRSITEGHVLNEFSIHVTAKKTHISQLPLEDLATFDVKG